jgi:hypothetical protein
MHALDRVGHAIDGQRHETSEATPLIHRAGWSVGSLGCFAVGQVFPLRVPTQRSAVSHDMRHDASQPVGRIEPCSDPKRNRSET